MRTVDHDTTGAVFSDDMVFRYKLWRIWDHSVLSVNFIGLNPSTADDRTDDPTIRKCIGFAKRNGYGGLVMTNLYAFRSTNPSALLRAGNFIGPDNDKLIANEKVYCGAIVAAWGSHPATKGRALFVRRMLGWNLLCLGITKNGSPKHPLYVPYSQPLIGYSRID